MRLIQDINSVSLNQKRKELLQTPTKMLLRRKVEESSEKRAKENKSYITTLIKIKTIKTRKMEIKIKMGNSVGVETKTSTKTRTVIIPNSRKETRKKVEIKRRMREIRSRP